MASVSKGRVPAHRGHQAGLHPSGVYTAHASTAFVLGQGAGAREEIILGSVYVRGASVAPIVQSEAESLRAELAELRIAVAALTQAVSALGSTYTLGAIKMRTANPESRNISVEDAVEEVAELFNRRGTLFYSEIAEELGLDIELVIEACGRLEATGTIKENAD